MNACQNNSSYNNESKWKWITALWVKVKVSHHTAGQSESQSPHCGSTWKSVTTLQVKVKVSYHDTTDGSDWKSNECFSKTRWQVSLSLQYNHYNGSSLETQTVLGQGHLWTWIHDNSTDAEILSRKKKIIVAGESASIDIYQYIKLSDDLLWQNTTLKFSCSLFLHGIVQPYLRAMRSKQNL